MHSHLVAVEVGVERSTYERMDLYCSALDKNGLESLNRKSVKRGSAVQKHGVLFDDLFQNVPNGRFCALDSALCALDIVALTAFNELFHYERFEKLDSHFLRKTALI